MAFTLGDHAKRTFSFYNVFSIPTANKNMKIIFDITRVVLILCFFSMSDSTASIIYKRVTTYHWLYNDAGTGAHSDLSIWRPYTLEHGYFALGDVAVATHNAPQTSAILVKDNSDDTLARPTGFTEIWNDRGSGGSNDVRIMQMNPPSGYVCLGHVAIIGYSNMPDSNLYRCVKHEYVSDGIYQLIWLDRGSGATLDAGIWGNRVSQSNLNGLDANTFTSFATHSTPGGSPSVLDSRFSQNNQDAIVAHNENIAVTVYEVTDMTQIWNDGGSGAYKDLAIWRSDGPANTFSLGDIAVGGGKPNKGYVAKAKKSDIFDAPYDFRQIWNDRGSGARWDGAFYEPLCNSGYRALGHVAMRNHNQKPDATLFRCVKAEYTTQGNFEWVWNDRGSGASRDVSVWKAVSSGNGQGVDAMSTVARHGDMYTLAYVLDATVTNYIVGKPAEQYILQNVHYLFDDRQIVNSEPESIARTILENRGGSEQKAERELSYSYEETYSWSDSAGLEIGVSTTVSAGVPLVGEAELSVSTTASFSYEWGGSTSETKSDTIRVTIVVQPHSQKSAVIVGNRYTVKLPYTATLITVYEDGSRNTQDNYRGVYEGVQVNEIRIVYEPDIPL